ncbi:MAG: ATP-binding protein [Anaerolineaceae bacterium]|nr:ATP-binding protein [Anaerolineaceae bacterium]
MEIIERSLFPSLKKALPDQRIIVISGMRRVGKTTTLRWLLDQVPSTNKIFLDLERLDQRAVFRESNYDLVLNYFRNLGMNPDLPMTVALDEIQYAPNLPSVVKYLYDRYGIKFLLTGSSSFYLKHFFSESMAGRKVVYEMFPLGFGEFLDFRNISYRRRTSLKEMHFDPHEFERLKSYYDEFVAYGGLPNVVLEPNTDVKREILKDIFSSYINMDVRVMADFRKIGELQQLLKALAIRIGNKLDTTKLAQIVGISRPTLNEYLEFLEKTYVIYRLPAYAGPDKTVALGKKLYFRDNGIASILANPGEGALFENSVFNQLREYGELAYLSKGNEYEVDFVLTPPDSQPAGLEVKYHPLPADNQKLRRIAQRNGLLHAWLVGRYASPGFEDFLWGGSIF